MIISRLLPSLIVAVGVTGAFIAEGTLGKAEDRNHIEHMQHMHGN
jgi:hypothetical protein